MCDIYMHSLVYVCELGSQCLDDFLYFSPSYLLRQGLSLNLGLARLAGQKAPRSVSSLGLKTCSIMMALRWIVEIQTPVCMCAESA